MSIPVSPVRAVPNCVHTESRTGLESTHGLGLVGSIGSDFSSSRVLGRVGSDFCCKNIDSFVH